MIITFQTASVGSQYLVVDPEKADTVRPEALTTWVFDLKDETTGSLIETGDTVTGFSLKRDPSGLVNDQAYDAAYKVSYGMVHLRSAKRNEADFGITKDALLSLPSSVLNRFYAQSQNPDWAQVKKEAPANPELPAA